MHWQKCPGVVVSAPASVRLRQWFLFSWVEFCFRGGPLPTCKTEKELIECLAGYSTGSYVSQIVRPEIMSDGGLRYLCQPKKKAVCVHHPTAALKGWGDTFRDWLALRQSGYSNARGPYLRAPPTVVTVICYQPYLVNLDHKKVYHTGYNY